MRGKKNIGKGLQEDCGGQAGPVAPSCDKHLSNDRSGVHITRILDWLINLGPVLIRGVGGLTTGAICSSLCPCLVGLQLPCVACRPVHHMACLPGMNEQAEAE